MVESYEDLLSRLKDLRANLELLKSRGESVTPDQFDGLINHLKSLNTTIHDLFKKLGTDKQKDI